MQACISQVLQCLKQHPQANLKIWIESTVASPQQLTHIHSKLQEQCDFNQSSNQIPRGIIEKPYTIHQSHKLHVQSQQHSYFRYLSLNPVSTFNTFQQRIIFHKTFPSQIKINTLLHLQVAIEQDTPEQEYVVPEQVCIEHGYTFIPKNHSLNSVIELVQSYTASSFYDVDQQLLNNVHKKQVRVWCVPFDNITWTSQSILEQIQSTIQLLQKLEYG